MTMNTATAEYHHRHQYSNLRKAT